MVTHEAPTGSQSSSGDGEGETVLEEGVDHTDPESPEVPLSLSDLLGYVFLFKNNKK